jgi:hypothetical protein
MDSPIDPHGQRGGKKAPIGYQEPIGRNTKGSVMMKTAPASSFVMTQSQFLLQFLIPLEDPAPLCHTDQVLECALCREGGEPVLRGFSFSAGPLDQQPLLGIGFVSKSR